MTRQRIMAVEITAYDPALPGTRTLYFSDGELTTGSTDTPALKWFDDRISATPNFERRAFGSARITSGGQSTAGVLELANTDQGLTYLLDLGIDGRDIVIRHGYAGDAYPAAWTTWLLGTVEQVEVGQDKVLFVLRDRTAILDLPLQSTRYAGTNSGAPLSGAEGVATDIKGQPKPLCWGRCYQVPAVLVNTGKLTFQVHDGSVFAIDAVYDKGAALTFGSDRANLAALEAAVIAAGSYDTCKALGLFRLGGSPAGRVTADVRGDNSGAGYVDRAGAVMRRVLEAKCGVLTANIATADFSALDTTANYELGIFVGTETTRRAVIEALQESVGAYCLPDRTGIWTTGQLVAPISSTVLGLTDAEISDIRRETTRDPGRGIPAWRVTLRYRRNWAAFATADLVAVGGSMTEAQRADLLQEWRTVVSSDATVQTKHLLATALEYDTLLIAAGDAQTEADRRLALHKVRRDYVRLDTTLLDETGSLDLLDEVKPDTNALGYSSTRQFAVLGLVRQDAAITLELWG